MSICRSPRADDVGMEDSHTVHLYLPPGGSTLPPSAQVIPEQPAGSTVSNDGVDERGPALAGVFDGHGGSTVAKFTGTTLHTRLANLDAYSRVSATSSLADVFQNLAIMRLR